MDRFVFKRQEGEPPAKWVPSERDREQKRKLDFHRMFVARTDVDPLNRGAGRPSKAALSAYQLHDEMRDAYGSYTGPLTLEQL